MKAKKRIRDRKGVQEGVLDALYAFKERHETPTFQVPLIAIAEEFKRDPKPSTSTVLRAALDLKEAGKIQMVKDPTNPRGPYTFTVEGYRPKALRAAPAVAIEQTDTKASTPNIVEIVNQIMARRTQLTRELAQVEKDYNLLMGAINKIATPAGAKVKRTYTRRKELVVAGV